MMVSTADHGYSANSEDQSITQSYLDQACMMPVGFDSSAVEKGWQCCQNCKALSHLNRRLEEATECLSICYWPELAVVPVTQ